MKTIFRLLFFILFLQSCDAAIASQSTAFGESKAAPVASKPESPEAKAAARRASKRLQLFQKVKDKSGPPPSGSVILLGITAGRSTMPEVEGLFGNVDIVVTGDASTTERSACYLGTDKTVAVFTSDEMSQGVGGVEVYASQSASGRAHCSISGKINRRLTTGAGIRLGMTKAEIHRKFGKPEKVLETYEVYSWSTALSISGQCENVTFYIISFENDLVASFQFGSHDSC